MVLPVAPLAVLLMTAPPALVAGQAKPPASQNPGTTVAPAPKPPPTAVIRGRVTSFPDGQPLARARVMLTRPDKSHAWVRIADDQGRYEFTDLEAFNNYMISVSKTGHAARLWGERQPPDPPAPLALAAGQVLESIDVALAPHLWIAGRIFDSDGSPFGGAVVSAVKAVFLGDRREMVPVAEIITNDRGEFRLFGLPAGQYYVSAMDPAFMSAGDHHGPLEYPPTYYPGVTGPEGATRLTLEPGQPRDNIEFRLAIVKPARITGRIMAPDNAALTSGAVIMTPLGKDGGLSHSGAQVDIRPDGTYDFFNVPPGRFLIRARGETEDQPLMLFGLFIATVSGADVLGADITLLPGGLLEGQVEWAGLLPRPSTEGIRVRAPTVDGSKFGDALTGDVGERGNFLIRGAIAGPHLVRIENLPEPWSLQAVVFRGQDVTDIPLEVEPGKALSGLRVILTDRSTKLEGRILSTERDDMESYKVVAFTANRLHWRRASRFVRLALPDRAGRFSFSGLPPAVYYLAAARDVDEGDLGETRTLDRLALSAITVRLTAGQRTVADLRVRPVRRPAGDNVPNAR